MDMKHLVILALLLIANVGQAEIYKWVDEDGITHFGAARPADTDSRKMNIHRPNSNIQAKASSSMSSGATHSAAGTEIYDLDISEDHPKTAINCRQVVHDATDHIVAALGVSEKNYRGGYISENNYQQSTQELLSIQKKLSVAECDRSSGETRQFYQCTGKNVNNITDCGKQFHYVE